MAEKLYEEAFSISFNWQKILPENVYRYHQLICQETNAPVDLQMATVLPFVGSCLGPYYERFIFDMENSPEFTLDSSRSIWGKQEYE